MVDSREERIAIGRIRTSHGVHGFLKVESYSGETEHFTRLSEVVLRNGSGEKSFAVEKVRASDTQLLMKFRGLDNREDARMLGGWEILVSRDHAAPLGSDEYYHSDLCKCAAMKEGTRLGRVRSVCEGGGGDLLEIELPSGKCHYVPFRKGFVGEVDIEHRVIEIEADWLLK